MIGSHRVEASSVQRTASLSLLLGTLVFIASALAACSLPAASTAVPVRPCVIIEGPRSSLSRAAPLSVDQRASPAYCLDARVRDDFSAAMDWYEARAERMQVLMDYPPGMADELATYYTGHLLHEARESIYYNQRAGRVLMSRWDAIAELSGPQWEHTGLRATLTVGVRGYMLVVLPKPPVAQTEQNNADSGQTFEHWQITMIYDPNDRRWKIEQAETLFEF